MRKAFYQNAFAEGGCEWEIEYFVSISLRRVAVIKAEPQLT